MILKRVARHDILNYKLDLEQWIRNMFDKIYLVVIKMKKDRFLILNIYNK